MTLLFECRADNVNGSGGKGGNTPISTTWHDLSGNGLNGTLTSFPTNAAYVNSVFQTGWSNVGSAASPYSLCGLGHSTSQYALFPNINGGVFPATGTLEIWYNAYSQDSGSSRNLATTGALTSSNNAIRFEQGTGPVLFVVIGGAGGPAVVSLTGDAIKNFADTQLVVTWNTGTNKFQVWVNGVQVLTNQACSTWPTNLSLTLLCGYHTTRAWDGSVRIARVYDVERTAAQIVASYLADAHPVVASTVGTMASYTLPTVNSDTWTTTNPAWSISGSTATFTGIFEDGGTIVSVPFVSGNGYGTLNVLSVCHRNFAALASYGGNPIIDFGSTNAFSTPWTATLNASGGNYFSLVQDGSSSPQYNDLRLWTSPFAGSTALKSWSDTGVAFSHSAATWEDKNLLHPNVLWYPAGNEWVGFYFAETSVGANAVGYATSPDSTTWTKYGSNPILSGYTTPAAYMVGSNIYLSVSKVSSGDGAGPANMELFISTTGPTGTWVDNGPVLISYPGDWDAGLGMLDSFMATNPISGTYEFFYTVVTGGGIQQIGAALTMDGYVFFKYSAAIVAIAMQQAGDPCGLTWENYFYLLYDLTPTASGAYLATLQSATTGLYLNINATCYPDGNLAYLASPNGFTDTNATAVPASGTATVEPTVYAAPNASLSVVGTNGVSISFVLPGFTIGHVYAVKKNGSLLSNVTADGSGHLNFSNSVWGGSDTITAAAAILFNAGSAARATSGVLGTGIF